MNISIESDGGIIETKRIGILAYGSLIDDPGEEIKAVTIDRIKEILTPFKVEFARSSRRRNGAPTLVPVQSGGANVKAQIYILKENVCEKEAADMLLRRETNKVGSKEEYRPPTQPNEDTVVVERLESFHGIDVVLYTKIGANIHPLTPQKLAQLAIKSALSEAGEQGRDGISYLINAKRNGIKTPLMSEYEREILQKVHANTLEEALEILQKKRLKRK